MINLLMIKLLQMNLWMRIFKTTCNQTYLLSDKRRNSKNTSPSCVVDNSIEISNISLTPRDFLNTLKVINLILEDHC